MYTNLVYYYMKMRQNKKLRAYAKSLTDTRVLGLLAFGIVALLVTWSGVKVVQTNYELDKEISIARQENNVDKLENENLKLRNTYYETAQFLELSARRQFGKAAAGEKLYTVPKEVAQRYVTPPEDQQRKEVGDNSNEQRSQIQANWDTWYEFLLR